MCNLFYPGSSLTQIHTQYVPIYSVFRVAPFLQGQHPKNNLFLMYGVCLWVGLHVQGAFMTIGLNVQNVSEGRSACATYSTLDLH